MQNRLERCKMGYSPALRLTAISMEGGSMETEITDEATMPWGAPSASRLVMIVTDAARRRMASRKSLPTC
jgi:hypothetical protein